jgi:hypothetical protein
MIGELLEAAKRDRLCTAWGCTTCGALPFRRLLADALGEREPFSAEASERLARSLSGIHRLEDVRAVEFLIRTAARRLGEERTRVVLADSPAGLLYCQMLEAKAVKDARRREHALRNSPEFVAANRAKKKADKAAAHAERLRLKAIRDAERAKMQAGTDPQET